MHAATVDICFPRSDGKPDRKVKRCKAGADIYYNAVHYFGHANFEKLSPAWCQAACTKNLGDPNKVLNG